MTSPLEATSPPLTPARRKALKARAHALHPVVTIGDKGLSPAVLREIDVNLKSHELIKVKAATDDRDLRAGFLAQICAALGAHPVQHIGKILVVFRPRPDVPTPAPAPTAKAAGPAGNRMRKAAPRRAAPVLASPGTGPGARAPINRGARKAPVHRGAHEAPVNRGARKAPVKPGTARRSR